MPEEVVVAVTAIALLRVGGRGMPREGFIEKLAEAIAREIEKDEEKEKIIATVKGLLEW